MGGYVTIIISLLSLCVAATSLLKSAWWPKDGAADAIAYVALIILIIALALLVAVIASSRKVGPARMRDLIDSWLTPSATAWSPDMNLMDVVLRVAPKFVRDANQGEVIQAQQEVGAKILRLIGRHASLGELQVFGQKLDEQTQVKATNPVPIDVAFWRAGGQVHYDDLLQNQRGKASVGGARPESYVNLQFDSRQVRKNFRKPLTLKFQRPWRWETRNLPKE